MDKMGNRAKHERLKKTLIVTMFLAMLILGLFITDDFTPQHDSFVQRHHSLVNYEYINRIVLNRTIPEINNLVPVKLEDYPLSSRSYGVFMQLPLVMIEDITGFTLSEFQIYTIRMYYTYSVFVLGLICMYLLLKALFRSRRWALIGVLFIYTFPLFFGSAFTNIKDLLFSSLFMISCYFMMRLFKKLGFWNILLFSFFSAIATNIRIIGLILPASAICMLLYEYAYQLFASLKDKTQNRRLVLLKAIGIPVIVLAMFLVFLYIITPASWADPVEHFKFTRDLSLNYKWDGLIKYRGQLLYWAEMPRWYLLREMIISIPVFITIGFVTGIGALIKNVFWGKRIFQKIYTNRYIGFYALLFLLPVSLQIYKHIKIYAGWRHMYFTFIPLVIVAVYGLIQITEMLRRSKKPLLHNLVLYCSLLSILINGIHTILSHPYHEATFNYPSNPIAMDYLIDGRTASSDGVDYVLEQFPDKESISFTFSGTTHYLLPPEKTARIYDASENERSDFYVEIYRYNSQPYPTITGYSHYHSVLVDGYPILSIYMRDDFK